MASGADLSIEGPKPEAADIADPELWEKFQERLLWEYPFARATRKPAKTSVSVLRRRAAEQLDDETSPLLTHRFSSLSPLDRERVGMRGRSPLSATDFGAIHHSFLQRVSLEKVGSVQELKTEGQRLVQEAVLTAGEMGLLDWKGLGAFWQSEIGQKVRAQAEHVRRELAFIARFSPSELAAITGEPQEPSLENEFVVVQGVADLVVLLPEEIWLIDFKTDRVAQHELAMRAAKYEPQLKLYARALSQIYRRPVSACWLYFLAQQTALLVQTPIGLCRTAT